MEATAFVLLDAQRRTLAAWLKAAGVRHAPDGGAVWAARPGFTLRVHGAGGPPVLCVPAPIKGPEVWYLHPGTSAVRWLRHMGHRPVVLEWGPPSARAVGLAGHAALVRQAAALIAAEAGVAPLVIGHSLGGTLAAVAALRAPAAMAALILLEAPLAFAAPWVRLARSGGGRPVVPMETVPGSMLDLLAVAALPQRFAADPAADAVAVGGDPDGWARHLRERRWTLGETPMPAPLFADLVELCAGDRLRPARLAVPVLSVIDPGGDMVDPAGTRAVHATFPDRRSAVRDYTPGPCLLRHLEPVVGRTAQMTLRPVIERWIAALGA